MDFKDIKKIVELMGEHGLTHFKLDQDDESLELKRGGDVDLESIKQIMSFQSAPVQGYAPAPLAAAPAVVSDEDSDGPGPGEVDITSPMVGTFYRSPSPEKDEFVQVGSTVSGESPVCIVEAMKVMNEIQAEVSGTIVQVLVENGTPVQYGEPLFRVRT